MTADQSNRIALAENLVVDAQLRLIAAEKELLAAQAGCEAAYQRLHHTREDVQVSTEGAVS